MSRVALVAVAAVAALAAVVPGAAARGGGQRCAGTHWVGAWGAAPSYAPLRVADQTLRQVVTPHLGGPRARVRLTNRFGTAPLRLDEVRLARTAAGAAVVRASSRRVTFGGRGGVTIAPGADVVSDPVRIRFRAFQDLTVSIYAGGGGPVSSHPIGSEDVLYVAPGNHAGEPGAGAFAAGPLRSWWIVNGIDVQAPERVGAAVTYGSSTTDGLLTTWADRAGCATPAGRTSSRAAWAGPGVRSRWSTRRSAATACGWVRRRARSPTGRAGSPGSAPT